MKNNNNELHVIIGISGGVGQALARQLDIHSKSILGINRSGTRPNAIPENIEIVAADILQTSSMIDLLRDRNATHIYNCIGLPYQDWVDGFPPITKAFISIIQKTGTIGIVADNLYMYGERSKQPFHEDLPYLAKGAKGKVRAETAKMYEIAMNKGVPIILCRAPDFYGPGVTERSFYGDRVFGNALAGKKVSLLGDLDKDRQIIYVDDFARAMIKLACSSDAIGQIWHVPTPEPITQREFVEMIFDELDKDLKLGSTPNFLINILALFVPMLREIKEMLYEFTDEYLVDDSKYRNTYGNGVTSHQQAIKETLDWYKQYQEEYI